MHLRKSAASYACVLASDSLMVGVHAAFDILAPQLVELAQNLIGLRQRNVPHPPHPR